MPLLIDIDGEMSIHGGKVDATTGKVDGIRKDLLDLKALRP